jgi:uncharacterized membrane protein
VQAMLVRITEITVLVIETMALVIIIFGTVGAFIATLKECFKRTSGHERRIVWLQFSRWLVAGLTFQLAADIVESSIATNWTSLGRLAAIAAIRTFLNYFLERDVADIRELENEHAVKASPQT